MTELVIAIGSNEQAERNITEALDQLSQQFGQLNISPVYQSQPQQNHNIKSLDTQTLDIKSYLNLVVSFETVLTVQELKHILKTIEDAQSRVRNSDSVSLDLDILLYADWVGEFDKHVIPHHDIHQCAYVLRPLADLLPDRQHPIFQKSYKDMWAETTLEHSLIPVDFVWRGNIISVAGCPLPL